MNALKPLPVILYSFLLMAGLSVYGCASYGGYKPVLDPQNDPHPERVEKDFEECGKIAEEAADTIKDAGKGTVVGGAIGAVTGAIIGAVTGDAGSGATVGAAIGGSGGAVKGGLSADEKYKRVYRNCMINRGHTVLG